MEKNIYGRGATILTDGNSVKVKTGAWKKRKPIHLEDKCKNCMFCVAYCPEGCIYEKDGKIDKIDLDYCKGCGICAKACPFKAIEMENLE